MLSIQPGRRRQRDEELAPVRVGSGVCHAEYTGASVLQVIPNLVLELFTVDAGAAPSRTGRIAALDHEVRDDAVEDGVVVVVARCQGAEVLAGFRCVGGIKLDDYGAHRRLDHDILGHCEALGSETSLVVSFHRV